MKKNPCGVLLLMYNIYGGSPVCMYHAAYCLCIHSHIEIEVQRGETWWLPGINIVKINIKFMERYWCWWFSQNDIIQILITQPASMATHNIIIMLMLLYWSKHYYTMEWHDDYYLRLCRYQYSYQCYHYYNTVSAGKIAIGTNNTILIVVMAI